MNQPTTEHLMTDSPRFAPSRFLVRSFAIAAAVAICALASHPVSAQQAKYKDLSDQILEKFQAPPQPFDASEEDLSKFRRKYKDQLRARRDASKAASDLLENGGDPNNGAAKEFFDGYFFPAMTLTDFENTSTFGAQRREFLKDFLDRDITGSARSNMINLTLEWTKKIAEDTTLHPAVRLNAVYLMAILDEVPTDRGAGQMPRPSSGAFQILKTIMTSADEDKHPQFLRVAAISGVQRHLEIEKMSGASFVTAGDKQAIANAVIQHLDSAETDDVTYWLKRRAIQLLGLMGNQQVASQAVKILENEDASLWLKLDAVEAIAGVTLSGEDASKAAFAVSEFCAKTLQAEGDSIKAAVDKLVNDNILFQDIDLAKTGIDFEKDTPAATGAAGTADGNGGRGGGLGSGPDGGRGGGMGPGAGGGLGGLGDGPGGPGGGLGGGLGGGGRGGGGFGAATAGVNEPIVELPGYQLNLIRRRLKSLAYVASNTIGGDDGAKGLARSVNDDVKELCNKTYSSLQLLLTKKSNVGLVDLEDRNYEPTTKTVSTANELAAAATDTGKAIEDVIRSLKGEPEGEPDPADPLAGATDAAPADAAPADDNPLGDGN